VPNRGKRSVVLDLAHDGGQALLRRIAENSDVFLTSYLPAVCRRLHIEVDDLRAANPSIIYARGTGWGSKGPLRDVGGYDLAAGWAISGLANRFVAGPDGPISQPPALFDMQAGNSLAGAVCAAMYQRERTGQAAVVEVAIMNVAMWAASADIVSAPYLDRGWTRTRSDAVNPLSNWFPTRDDRWLYLVLVQSDRYWTQLCDVLGQPGLASDPRFSDSRLREANGPECVAALDAVFRTRTLDEWRTRFEKFSGPWAPALTFREVHDHQQVSANGFLLDVTGNDGRQFRVVASPAQFDQRPLNSPRPAPELGQDTEMVLLGLGLDWDEISAARQAGSLGPASGFEDR
jgi:formyl-CoA transferase